MTTTTRIWLSERSWIDHTPGWLPDADAVMTSLLSELSFVQERSRRGPQPRLTAVCGRSMSPESGYERPNPDVPWTPTAANVRDRVLDAVSGRCPAWRPTGLIANHYRTGRDSIDWHADDEVALGPEPIVVSVSLGVTRNFLVRPSDPGIATKTRRIPLSSGDMAVMGGATQREFEHSFGKVVTSGARLSLTFRDYP